MKYWWCNQEEKVPQEILNSYIIQTINKIIDFSFRCIYAIYQINFSFRGGDMNLWYSSLFTESINLIPYVEAELLKLQKIFKIRDIRIKINSIV